ncbi:MAG: ABC transporter substrate-binding protein, partial [Clostridia bacterium]|nr:ABC transporter substrate-binding protein [Clostridia bacterium]
MKRFISLLLCLVMVFGCVCVLAGCEEKVKEEVKDEGAQIAVYLGDTMYDFDPTDMYVSDNVAQVMSLLFEPLFRRNAKGKLQMAAAKKYKVNKKERTIVITLRQSYFSDGTRVSAANFIYAWRDRILDAGRQSAAAPLLYDIENAAEIKNGSADPYSFGAEATGTYELTIHYREGADVDQLLKNLANVATSPVLDSSVMTSSYAWSKSTNTCVGNGPFKISMMSTERGIFSLERNKGYHQPTNARVVDAHVKPYTLVTFWEENEEQALTSLTYDQIENKAVFFMGEATLETCKNFKKKAKTADTMSTFSFIFNTTSTNEYLADAHVRKALSLALDRDAIAAATVFGKAANGLVGGAKKGILSAGADVAGAQAELAKATATGAKAFTLTVNDDE